MGLSLLTLAMSKKYTDNTIIGLGSDRVIKGASCTIKDIQKEGNTNIITFEWTAENGQKEVQTMTVEDGRDGADGISILGMKIENNEFVLTLSDGTVLRSGVLPTGAVPVKEFKG